MKKLWFVIGAGAVTLFFFGFWMKNNHEVPCEDCIVADTHFFQIFSSPTTDLEKRMLKFQSLSSQSYPHFRVAISAEEAAYPDVQEWLKKEPVRFVKLPDTVPHSDLMYQWVQTIPDTDIVVYLPAEISLEVSALEQLQTYYSNSDHWYGSKNGLLTGYADLFQKIDIDGVILTPERQLADLAQGHVSSLEADKLIIIK